MQALEKIFGTACTHHGIAGTVLAAVDKTGDFAYSKAFGVASLEEGRQAPLQTNAVFALASCTKLLTTIAALQLVEHGKFGLDDDVAAVLPELAACDVLSCREDGGWELQKRKNCITLRRLLTHSSGLAYVFIAPELSRYWTSLGHSLATPPTAVVESFKHPLISEPNTSWTYSPGLDWAGLLIARVSGTSLEVYLQDHIFTPLGIQDITFWPDQKPELAARRPATMIRNKESGKAVPFTGPDMSAGALEELGGQGCYASMPSYLKILHSLLADDEKLLRRETAAIMFTPQLTEASQAALQEFYTNRPPRGPCSIGHFPSHVKYDWGLGGLLTTQDVVEDGLKWRRAGHLSWAGMFNSSWFIDREAGLCGVFGAQMLPSGDQQVNELMELWEKTLYKHVAHQGRM
ncbi:hypothetical protein SLS56_011885 [Neofusicoccum ribis]|uniref:Beta-lactamase-related domain-containing protein n=1 Tax=Neofusicoccum ribis TaxID=45134 RepID=A0ABR3SAD2_9PEZI